MIDDERDMHAGELAQQALDRFRDEDDCQPRAVAALLNAAALVYLLTWWEEETTKEQFKGFAGMAYDNSSEAIAEVAREEGCSS